MIILLVDDTPADIQVAHNILRDTYNIKIATSGAKALELAKTLPQPDLMTFAYDVASNQILCQRSSRDGKNLVSHKMQANPGRGRSVKVEGIDGFNHIPPQLLPGIGLREDTFGQALSTVPPSSSCMTSNTSSSLNS
jgi:hypothetical protein